MTFSGYFFLRGKPVSSEIQLLGVTLDNKLKFNSHIASIC